MPVVEKVSSILLKVLPSDTARTALAQAARSRGVAWVAPRSAVKTAKAETKENILRAGRRETRGSVSKRPHIYLYALVGMRRVLGGRTEMAKWRTRRTGRARGRGTHARSKASPPESVDLLPESVRPANDGEKWMLEKC